MAKPLIINFAGTELSLFLNKVDRSDLYGYVEIETLDSKGHKCTTATLADDGKTLVGSGGAALAMLSPDGEWLEKRSLTPTDNQGKAITPVASSYTAPVPLAGTATIDDYLSHNIRAVYQLSSDADLAPLMEELKKGTIFTFPYSFRGGLEPDVGFLLLAADGTPFLAVGCPTTLEFVGFDQSAGIAADEEESSDDEESLDFSMM